MQSESSSAFNSILKSYSVLIQDFYIKNPQSSGNGFICAFRYSYCHTLAQVMTVAVLV
jgi:hypothetical protein